MKNYISPEIRDVTAMLGRAVLDFEVNTSDTDEVSEGTVGGKDRDGYDEENPKDEFRFGNLW